MTGYFSVLFLYLLSQPIFKTIFKSAKQSSVVKWLSEHLSCLPHNGVFLTWFGGAKWGGGERRETGKMFTFIQLEKVARIWMMTSRWTEQKQDRNYWLPYIVIYA